MRAFTLKAQSIFISISGWPIERPVYRSHPAFAQQKPGSGNGIKSVCSFQDQDITRGQTLTNTRDFNVERQFNQGSVYRPPPISSSLHLPWLQILDDTKFSKTARQTRNIGPHAKNFSTHTAINFVLDFERIGSLLGIPLEPAHCTPKTASS